MNRHQRRKDARQANQSSRSSRLKSGAKTDHNALDMRNAFKFFQSGQIERTSEMCRQILGRDRNNADALHLSGLVAYQRGQTEAAVELIKRSLTLNPDCIVTLNALGAVLLTHGKLSEAISKFQDAVTIDPNFAEAYNNLGAALKSGGRFDEATIAFEKALTIKPDYALPYKGLVAIKKIEPDENLIPRIEQQLRKTSLSENDRSDLNFALGKCFDDIGEFDKAFHHYRNGNEIRHHNQPYEAVAMAEKIARITVTYTRSFLEENRTFGSESKRPVFIIGMPRSGTSLVEQILASHPAIFGAGELQNFNQMADCLAITQQTNTDQEYAAIIDQQTAHRLEEEYLAHLKTPSA